MATLGRHGEAAKAFKKSLEFEPDSDELKQMKRRRKQRQKGGCFSNCMVTPSALRLEYTLFSP